MATQRFTQGQGSSFAGGLDAGPTDPTTASRSSRSRTFQSLEPAPQTQTPPSKAKKSKPRSSLIGFLTLKEPSAAAFQQFADLHRNHPDLKDYASSNIIRGSAKRLPENVPSVSSKWDGLPTGARQRLRAESRKPSSERLLSSRGEPGPAPKTPFPKKASKSPSQSSFEDSPRSRATNELNTAPVTPLSDSQDRAGKTVLGSEEPSTAHEPTSEMTTIIGAEPTPAEKLEVVNNENTSDTKLDEEHSTRPVTFSGPPQPSITHENAIAPTSQSSHDITKETQTTHSKLQDQILTDRSDNNSAANPSWPLAPAPAPAPTLSSKSDTPPKPTLDTAFTPVSKPQTQDTALTPPPLSPPQTPTPSSPSRSPNGTNKPRNFTRPFRPPQEYIDDEPVSTDQMSAILESSLLNSTSHRLVPPAMQPGRAVVPRTNLATIPEVDGASIVSTLEYQEERELIMNAGDDMNAIHDDNAGEQSSKERLGLGGMIRKDTSAAPWHNGALTNGSFTDSRDGRGSESADLDARFVGTGEAVSDPSDKRKRRSLISGRFKR